jgi:hypothetical protein
MYSALGSGVKKFFLRTWRIARWPLAVLAMLYVVGILYELSQQPKRAAAALEIIRSQKLTMEDVDGKHLPPAPDPKLADATVEGIDANGNGIRDDVELAIFKKYPNDIKLRAASLQYAMELQNQLTNVVDSLSYIAAIKLESRGYGCVFDTGPKVTLDDPNSKWIERSRIVNLRIKEVNDLVFNTDDRQNLKERNAARYMTSYSLPEGQDCDIAQTSLKS